jgi:acetolactate decarboxylase
MNQHLARIALAHHDGNGRLHNDSRQGHAIFQSSTMSALLAGIYDGDVTIAELLAHGNFGLGTFNHLDGEMVVINGSCYRLRSDGSATRAATDDRTPFAVVTWFASDHREPATGLSRAQLTARLDDRIASPNLFYAIRVDGRFRSVKTRTVTAQQQPYPPFARAVAEQAERAWQDVDGTLVGFRTPDYEQGISVAGYHLHFITRDRRHGGHVIDFQLARGRCLVSTSSELRLSLPRRGPFLTADLSPTDVSSQIHATED